MWCVVVIGVVVAQQPPPSTLHLTTYASLHIRINFYTSLIHLNLPLLLFNARYVCVCVLFSAFSTLLLPFRLIFCAKNSNSWKLLTIKNHRFSHSNFKLFFFSLSLSLARFFLRCQQSFFKLFIMRSKCYSPLWRFDSADNKEEEWIESFFHTKRGEIIVIGFSLVEYLTLSQLCEKYRRQVKNSKTERKICCAKTKIPIRIGSVQKVLQMMWIDFVLLLSRSMLPNEMVWNTTMKMNGSRAIDKCSNCKWVCVSVSACWYVNRCRILTLRSSVSTIKWLFFIVIVISDPFALEWWFICPAAAAAATLSSHCIDVISAFDIKLSLLWLIPFASQSTGDFIWKLKKK